MNKTIEKVTERIIKRSEKTRNSYVKRMQDAETAGPVRHALSCGNLAHGFAACDKNDKEELKKQLKPNIAVVSSYNDMLSAHQPYERFPKIIKEAARANGAVAQFAGGVPAMCDGITQGQDGMDLSLLSRDTIALATAISLSHNMFDAALMLGICDKIVPGLLIGALSFGHLPVVFVPGGPMPSGISNKEKVRVRELYEQGKVTKEELLDAESKSYHAPGTCTFYGTANSNQMLMEIMGLQLPGSSFVNPGNELRDELTREAVKTVIKNTNLSGTAKPLYKIISEKAIVNGIIGLLATGGSSNHTIHLISMAKAAGIKIDWSDFAELSEAVPLICRIYPNGEEDVNYFHASGGMGFVIRELLESGLLNNDVETILGKGLEKFTVEPKFEERKITWKDARKKTLDDKVLRPVKEPFKKDGGIKLLSGNLGRAIMKTSAIKEENYVVEAPAMVFHDQSSVSKAFKEGKLNKDFIAVVKYQGPKANGMPELHKLTSTLGVLQNLGYKVGLVTDGRMSGASAKIPAAIHLTPECLDGGQLAKIKDGDVIRIDASSNILEVKISDAELEKRAPEKIDLSSNNFGTGRELFINARKNITSAEEGATFIL